MGCDEAIIEVRQSRYGKAVVRYGKGELTDRSISSDSSGVLHRFSLSKLEEGTAYGFYVVITDVYGRESTLKNINDERQEVNFSFTTGQNCPTNANIENVKVCKVTSDSAEIFWYTPDGEYDSKVTYGEQIPPTTVQDGDISGHPTKFHYVKIGGLKEKTKYYFYVESGDSRDDNLGQLYTFTTPVEHVKFDVRTLRYMWGDQPGLGINIINQDSKSYDSLEIRIYFRSKEGLEKDLGARLDICVLYHEDGYQETIDGDLKQQIWNNLVKQKPTKMEDTYDPSDETYAYYLSLPLWGVEMNSQSRIRLDVIWVTWEPVRGIDLLGKPPQHKISDRDWSFGPHSKASGDPVDYPGVPELPKDDVDKSYFDQPINYYVTIYRKEEYVWGYSPSKAELATKKTHFELTSQVTSPIINPSEDYYLNEGSAKTVSVKGYAKVLPVDGRINDIWVNGVRLADPSSVITWNQSTQNYDFDISVPVKNGRNQVDVTLFAGPSENCEECFGCAVTNHSFFIEAPFIQQYPSNLSVRDVNLNVMGDTAKIDTTVFHVIVTDKNGNQNHGAKDTLWVSVYNPINGDSNVVRLVETADSSNVFQTEVPISVVSLSAAQTGPAQISMSGGDKIFISYIDPTDPADSSGAYLVSKADFPVALAGKLRDVNGDGAIEEMVVEYSIPLTSVPDSFVISFPNATTPHTAVAGVDSFRITDSRYITVYFNPLLPRGVTGFSSGSSGQGKSYLTHQGNSRVSSFPLADSAGPVLNGPVTYYERLSDGNDTLTVSFSEIINVSKFKGDVLILHKLSGNFPLNVLGVIGAEPGTNTLKIIVNSGSAQIEEGDSVSISSAGALTDMSGNHAHPSNPHVPVIIKAASPRLSAACYKDTDHNGKIDLVEITFLKEVDTADLQFGFNWNNDPRVLVSRSSVFYPDTDHKKINVHVEGLLTGTQIVTGGAMWVTLVHADYPDNEMGITAVDSAAPVIVSALFAPSDGNTAIVKDTLTITFSEPVKDVISSNPFNLLSTGSGREYSLVLEFLTRIGETKQVFLVTFYKDIDFPSNNDSIRIDPESGIADQRGIVQIYPDNRYAPLQMKSAKFSIEIDLGPNPFVINQSLIEDNGEMPPGVAGRRGIVIKVSPLARVTTMPELSGNVEIMDALGSKIFKGNLVKGTGNTSNLYLAWDGTNKRGRYVGTGVYIAIISVEDKDGYKKTQLCKIGVKRK